MVVVAGGGGNRFGGPKQFAELHGRTLLQWSIDAAATVAEGVVVVVPAEGIEACRAGAPAVVRAVVAGGPTRAASVRAGLAAVPDDAEIVVVHDAARPLASPALFRRVVDAVVAGAAGAVPGLPVADTLKEVRDDVVVGTTPRDGLVAVQTPQAFRADVLREAHGAGDDATDDAALVEARGATVRVVPGDPHNVKVTTPEDLEVLRALAPR
ncbi:MAG TPA: 2-C-methyl-D-erythritol 4-phosphate cytidylyltransferase [Acidimicrobiales bacterium]|nr:2-C-methyl-D-erythritol 4-phosphate cytidylyltransferase [Acidimicrobiales bacterium]